MDPVAEWATPEIIEQIKALHAQGRGAKYIGDQIGVSKGMASGLLWRMKLRPARLSVDKSPQVHEFYTGVAPAWGTPKAVELYKTLWAGGVKSLAIDEFFDISRDQSRTLRERLCIPKRDPFTSASRRDDRAIPKVSEPKPNRPLGSANGGRTVHFLSTLVNWSAIGRIKIEYPPGQCRWPLTCTDQTTGKWCAHHAALLGKRVA